MKLFADVSSIFSRVSGFEHTRSALEKDLDTVPKLGYQWKMIFSPDITKQGSEIIFSAKNDKPFLPSLSFNNIPVARVCYTKHLASLPR